jgi:uncharacterized protein YraI
MSSIRSLLVVALALPLWPLSANAAVIHTTSNLNLRSGPGLHYPVRVVIPVGSWVNIGRCDRTWCHLTWKGHTGYSDTKYLRSHVVDNFEDQFAPSQSRKFD